MIKQICFLLVLLGGYSVSMMAADKKEVYIARTESTVTIGNEYLSREFSLADGKVRTRVIENKRTGSEAIRILPEVASEEFVIRKLRIRWLRIFILPLFHCRKYRLRKKGKTVSG